MHAVVVAVPRRALFSVAVKLRVVRQETQDFRAAKAPEVLARTSRHARLLELLEVLTRATRQTRALESLAQQRGAAARRGAHQV